LELRTSRRTFGWASHFSLGFEFNNESVARVYPLVGQHSRNFVHIHGAKKCVKLPVFDSTDRDHVALWIVQFASVTLAEAVVPISCLHLSLTSRMTELPVILHCLLAVLPVVVEAVVGAEHVGLLLEVSRERVRNNLGIAPVAFTHGTSPWLCSCESFDRDARQKAQLAVKCGIGEAPVILQYPDHHASHRCCVFLAQQGTTLLHLISVATTQADSLSGDYVEHFLPPFQRTVTW